MLRRVPVDKSRSTFLDFGAGKGRAVCAAATFPFQRIIGVEISETLLTSAQSNLARMRHRKTQHVELIHADAAAFDVPGEVNLIHIFNPFVGTTLQRVIRNIHASNQEHPRKIYIIYFNNDHFDRMLEGQHWIRKSCQTQFYPSISCGLYETLPERVDDAHPKSVQ
jgi:predicted RNA methylase